MTGADVSEYRKLANALALELAQVKRESIPEINAYANGKNGILQTERRNGYGYLLKMTELSDQRQTLWID